MHETVEIVDPVIKVAVVVAIAQVAGLRWSVGQSVWTMYFAGDVV